LRKKDAREAFNELLDSLPSTDGNDYAPFVALIKAFPTRTMSSPERRGAVHLNHSNHQWPFYDVTFNGWEGAAGRREIALVESLQRFTEDGVKAGFIDSGGWARMSIVVDYGDMPIDTFKQVLNLIRPYRVDSGYTWVAYKDLKEAPRG
jgi:hypothetical protein